MQMFNQYWGKPQPQNCVRTHKQLTHILNKKKTISKTLHRQMQGLRALTDVSLCVRWVILHKKQLVCTQRDPCSILNCFERKGTAQETRQYGLKFWWVTLREANLMTAGWQTVPASTNLVLLCQITPCQASGGELPWWSCPREDIILHFSILGDFFS